MRTRIVALHAPAMATGSALTDLGTLGGINGAATDGTPYPVTWSFTVGLRA